MNTHPKIKGAIKNVSLVAAAVVVLITIDTAPVAVATLDLSDTVSKGKAATALIADIKALDQCNGLVNDDGSYQPAWRECYLSSVHDPSSVKGAYVHAMRALSWLDRNPNDDAVRSRANEHVEAGWAAHKAYETLYVVHEKAERAVNRSIFLSLRNGGADMPITREVDARLLEQAELALGAPELFKKQTSRKISLAMARETR